MEQEYAWYIVTYEGKADPDGKHRVHFERVPEIGGSDWQHRLGWNYLNVKELEENPLASLKAVHHSVEKRDVNGNHYFDEDEIPELGIKSHRFITIEY